MKKLTLIVFLFTFISCGKGGDNAPSLFVLQAMTDGQWKVSNYDKGTTDVTSDFNGYSFQFKTNLTVDALKNGATEKSGNWTADGSAKTITANFTSASNPLDLLNGTWNISNTTWTSVDATQSVNGVIHTLRLDKL
jgi:hypothetical protein